MDTPRQLGPEESATVATTWNSESRILTCKHQCSQGGKGKTAQRYQVKTSFDFSEVSEVEIMESLAGNDAKVKWRSNVGFASLNDLSSTDNQVVSVRELLDNAKSRRADPVKQAKTALDKMDKSEVAALMAEMQAKLDA